MFDVKVNGERMKIELVQQFVLVYDHCVKDWINKKRNDQV
jgi:hypothetical protein